MSRTPGRGLDWESVRHRLKSLRGRDYWRELEAVSDSEEFRRRLCEEVPRPAAALPEGMDRREFVTLIGAALALGGFAGCGRPPEEKIVPAVRPAEPELAGRPLFYATAMSHPGGATGLLVRNDEGRPTKVEGNPRHPASLGGTDPFAQASIYSLWDPDRSQGITRAGNPSTWPAFVKELAAALEGPRARRGAGLAILTEEVLSPTLAAQLDDLLRTLPEARWYCHDPLGRSRVAAASRLAFGEDLEPIYHFDRADVVVALDSDFLSCGPARERYAHDYTSRRRAGAPGTALARLYAAESSFTPTGSMADHRWAVRSSDIESVARSLAAALGLVPAGDAPPPPWIEPVVRDLRRHAGRSVVLAGRDQSAAAQAFAFAVNHALGNAGKTVEYIEPAPQTSTAEDSSLSALASKLARGTVEVLVILGGNPVYTAPGGLDLGGLLSRVKFRVRLGEIADETSWLCHWHVPEAHYLESWSDARAYDGTASVVQPLIAPLYGGRTAHEIVSAIAGRPGRSSYDLVRDHWRRRRGDTDFEAFWLTALHDGVIPGTAHARRRGTPRSDAFRDLRTRASGTDDVELVLRPDPTVADGRFANNAWLQELPKPITKLTWENAALMGPRDAARRELETGDVVELAVHGRAVRAPVFVVPGHAERSVTLHLGYGRGRAGRVGSGIGVDAFALQGPGPSGSVLSVSLRKTGDKVRLATTQTHHAMEGRDPIRETTAVRYAAAPDVIRTPDEKGRRPTLYPEYRNDQYAWGMLIDQSVCTGCNACVVACQVENNVPVVGRSEVLRGREMHWLRIDTYFGDAAEAPSVSHQPVPCMHCEKAPCELVCPVNATTHSSEGLNQMVYNRCVGTRYCSNNCPYKVRRFNFFQYADYETSAFREMYNPDVSVRERGVMEKCTYCVQRITRARIEAEADGRRIRDGEMKTACQQACPNGAIVFGDLSLRESEVARAKASPLNYELLGELNTQPRTTYLARVRNPNPELEGA
jgi:molybdopterin-containing oxidoreductase family iron-sulfur binding subunit